MRRNAPAFIAQLLALELSLSLVVSAFSQETTKSPLSEEQVMGLVNSSKLGEVSVNRVVELITERGLAFAVTDVFLLELDVKETDAAITQTLRRMRDAGRDMVPSQSQSPQSPPEKPPENSLPPAVGKVPTESEWPKFLESARAKALAYTEDLPNFICTQITARSVRFFPRGWQQVDNFVADLTYFEKKESYKILTVANRVTTTATMENLPGARSTGEFGSSLRALFDPLSNTTFRMEGVEQTNGRDTIRISFQVPKETSNRSINFNDERIIVTAYRGRCWIDPESFQIVRLEERAVNIPEDFPITRSEGSIDYDLQDISGKKYWLPVRAEMLLVQGSAKLHTKNVIEFKRYRKFEAEVKIVPE